MNRSVFEPTLANFSNPFLRYFAATRPAFLVATLAACLLGQAGAIYSGIQIQPLTAVLTVLLALIVHAGVNVINDYFDALNGTDASNTERLYPFTGGSRFIQNGILTPKQIAHFGYLLLGMTTVGGLWLSWQVGSGLLLVGAAGTFLGWAYSAVPLRLNSRGLGELCVLLGFLAIAVGSDYVQRQTFSFQPYIVGMPYALLVTSLLYINQFPDREADAMAGKRNLVVRLPSASAVWGYLLLVGIAVIWLLAMAQLDKLPVLALLSVLPLVFSLCAFWILRQFFAQPSQLLPAIKWTLASMLSHALLLVIILLWKSQ
ncbi:MAG: prenyltransferase [Methylotenera sp.]|nr:prenyltransferase [Methylotenera sp.]MDO9233853.1 prenyltransferase [Methylotenera sp.]MDO9389792.1 prenyltransferase [Methylotenera sp.]MDP2102965.1 prenyltransferase [Methylotenera sp.]MDP2282216.1 prenyltransferase [Methylotenera sp.]